MRIKVVIKMEISAIKRKRPFIKATNLPATSFTIGLSILPTCNTLKKLEPTILATNNIEFKDFCSAKQIIP